MAVLFDAKIVPSKLELLQTWVPYQPWAETTDTSRLTVLGAYRFDDPAGSVGLETHLLAAADGTVLQVPLTYRDAPLPGADLITTMTHTTLGDRWVYDGCTDPVWITALATTILTGRREAELFLQAGGRRVAQPSTGRVHGSGTPGTEIPDFGGAVVTHDESTTRICSDLTITLFRIPVAVAGTCTLTGAWAGQRSPLLLANIT